MKGPVVPASAAAPAAPAVPQAGALAPPTQTGAATHAAVHLPAAAVPHVVVSGVPQVPPQAAPPQIATMALTPLQQHAPWLTHGIAAIAIATAIGMTVLLAVQTTKQEGLSGTIGGRVETSYRGRPGTDEQLKRFTGFVVGVWLVCYLVLSLTGI